MNTTKMDDEYINQNDIVQRYLQNKLTPEETVEFEEYILDKPELLERLEIDAVLMDTLPQVKTIPKIEQIRSHDSFLTKVLVRWQVFLPTVCSLVLLSLLFLNDTPSVHETVSQIHYLENLRSASQIRTESITIEPETDLLVLVVTPMVLSEKHQITLTNSDGQNYSREQSLSDFGQLSILIDKNFLQPGKVRLQIAPITDVSTSNSINELMEIGLVFNHNNTVR